MGRPPLTDRQQTVLTAIRGYSAEHGHSPALRDLMPLVGLSSPSSVAWQIRQLVALGYLRRGAQGSARTVSVVVPESECVA